MLRRIPWVVLFVFAPLLALAQAAGVSSNPSNVPGLPSDIPKDAVLYTAIMAGQPAGQVAVWNDSARRHHSFFQFNDRGRGPKVTSVVDFGPSAVPSTIRITGNDYYKKPVDEQFTVAGKQGTWKSPAEQGSAPTDGKAFYVAMNGTPEDFAVLARALLANGDRLALLPSGEAHIEKVRDLKIDAGDKSQIITAYAITGIDFAPDYLWLDADHSLFAAASSWFSTIREGWEGALPAILKAQDQAANAYAATLALRLTHHPSKPLLIYNANVFDSAHATVIPRQTVIVAGDKIQSVAPSKPADRSRTDVELIDGSGKMLLPGLWDMHVHIGPTDGMLHLAAGVTTVRDLANDIDDLGARMKRFDAGVELGPRVIPAGIIDGPGPFQGPTKVLVSTPGEARAAVDRYHQLGYPQIKIYSSVKPELVPIIIEEAHKNGQRVSGHIPAGMIAAECVRDGYNEIQHINFIVLNFFPDVKETRTPQRFTVPGEHAIELDPKSERVQGFFHLLLEKQVDVDPTMATFEDMLISQPGEVPVGWRKVAGRLPPQVRRGLLNGGIAPPGKIDLYRRSYAAMEKLVKAMYDDGIPLDAGTDDVAGFTYQRELEILNESGIPAPKVLQLATFGSAKIMSIGDRGVIAPGKLADLVLIDGDPTKDISDIRKVDRVIKGGAVFDPRKLDEAIGVKPR